MKKNVIYILLLILLILIDQIIKNAVIINGNAVIINNVLEITYTKNFGGAFSIGFGHANILITANIVIIGIIITLSYINKNFNIGTLLILTGGFSNLYDRVSRGFVVDYLDITNIINFPIFNLSDICIVIGTILFVIAIYGGKNENI